MTEGERNVACGVGGGRLRLKLCPCSIGYCSTHILPTLALSLSLDLHICILWILNSVCGIRNDTCASARTHGAMLDGKVGSSWRFIGAGQEEIQWSIWSVTEGRSSLHSLTTTARTAGGERGLQIEGKSGWNKKHSCYTLIINMIMIIIIWWKKGIHVRKSSVV